MCGLLDLYYLLSFLRGLGIVQTKVSASIAHSVSTSTIPLSFHGFASHVGPLGLLPLSLGFLSPYTLSLPLIPLMGLLTVIPAMLAH